MNWTKLKISAIVIVSAFITICPVFTFARQLYKPLNNHTNTIAPFDITNQPRSQSNSLQPDKTKDSAETILKMVLEHLNEHDPSYFNSYTAITHQRFRIKNNTPRITEGLPIDTAETTRKNTDLFSAETLSFQKRLKPEYNQTEILSTKMEGKDNGSFAELSSCLHDISLLKPTIRLFDKNYLSPFSRETSGDYVYSSGDSVTASGDSLYLITFHPKLDKHLDGFCGTATIDKKKYAIQQIHAQSAQNDTKEPVLIINQNFAQINGVWLPSDKNIKVFFHQKNPKNQPDTKEENLIAESTINNYQQRINPALMPDDFNTAVQPASIVSTPTSALSPNNYIYIPMNQKDSLTQQIADSAIIAYNEKHQLKIVRLMAEGKVSLGYFNLDYNKLFGYNLYEGVKLGLGGETNNKLWHHLSLGGYISYGLKDKSLRHGEWINFYPTGGPDLRIHLGYKDMNLEFGNPEFLETKSLLNPENYRNLLIKNMFSTKRYTIGLEFHPFNELNFYLFGDLSENSSRQNTQFLTEHPFNPISLTRTGLQLRYSPGIKFQLEDGHQNEIKAPKSDYYLTIIQGVSILGGEYRYTKLELKGKFDLPFSKIGATTMMVRGGTMTQNAPIIELFNGYGSFAGTFSLTAPYSFATMLLNEFAAANYSALHIRHNFSTWLFPVTSQKQPAFIFAQNIGFGQLNNQYLAQVNLRDYRKGFYESGFEVNNLLRMDYLSWGVGIYYRYGPYQFSSAGDNFAYKFGFFFKL